MDKKSYPDPSAPKPQPGAKKPNNDKKERLAKALRDNLVRRKAASTKE